MVLPSIFMTAWSMVERGTKKPCTGRYGTAKTIFHFKLNPCRFKNAGDNFHLCHGKYGIKLWGPDPLFHLTVGYTDLVEKMAILHHKRQGGMAAQNIDRTTGFIHFCCTIYKKRP